MEADPGTATHTIQRQIDFGDHTYDIGAVVDFKHHADIFDVYLGWSPIYTPKFEFGLMADDSVLLIDEVMTPDSSRYWPKDQYAAGRPQPSFDKQYVRDYLEEIRWNKQPPVPSLPEHVISGTRDKYLEAFHRLTGKVLL